jgi:hypothetical protein
MRHEDSLEYGLTPLTNGDGDDCVNSGGNYLDDFRTGIGRLSDTGFWGWDFYRFLYFFSSSSSIDISFNCNAW